MRSIEFKVEGELPPKKDGANSMWGKKTEARRLIELRRAALKEIGTGQPFAKNIRLTLCVHVGLDEDRVAGNKGPGDLDNFVAGVCDGLMRAHPNTPNSSLHDLFGGPENPVHPRRTVAIEDDSHVVKIDATKDVGCQNDPSYEVVLEGE